MAVVYDKSTLTLYLNGVNQGSAYWGGDLVMSTNSSSFVGTAGSYYFNGIIDDLMAFNRTLSQTEVSLLYQGATPTPVSTITSLKLTGTDAMITFTTVTNAHYEVDYKSNLAVAAWSILTNGIAGTGGILSVTDRGAASLGRRFYRVGAHF